MRRHFLSSIFCVIVALSLVFSLTGCASNPEPPRSYPDHPTEAQTVPVQEESVVSLPSYAGNVAQLAYGTGSDRLAVLHTDGTVTLYGSTVAERSAVSKWKNVIQVCVAPTGTYGLKHDGTVLSTTMDLSAVNGVVDLVANYNAVMGLRRDGTAVIATMESGIYTLDGWHSITDIYAETNAFFGIRADGTVAVSGNTNYNVSGWTDVAELYPGAQGLFGLKKDGTVLVTHDSERDTEWLKASGAYSAVSSWKNITAIYPDCLACAIDIDGRLLPAGGALYENYDMILGYDMDLPKINLKNWTNLRTFHVSSGFYMAGLKQDGTVITFRADMTNDGVGSTLDTGNWKNMMQLLATDSGLIGLCSDGTLRSASTYSEFPLTLPEITDAIELICFGSNNELWYALLSDGTLIGLNSQSENMLTWLSS